MGKCKELSILLEELQENGEIILSNTTNLLALIEFLILHDCSKVIIEPSRDGDYNYRLTYKS